MRALEILQEISNELSALNIEQPAREAELLLQEGLGLDTVKVYRDNPEISTDQHSLIRDIIKRRASHEPLQYITGSTGFLDLRISVGKGVLIPRPETELMAEIAIKKIGRASARGGSPLSLREERQSGSQTSAEELKSGSQKRPDKRPSTFDLRSFMILDLCTGSGCLALALAKHFPDSRVCGVDISEDAIGYAVKNAAANGIENAGFIQGSLFGPLGQNTAFDLIISNPPYIRKSEICSLQPEITEWEPLGALDGGEDGLDLYREIIPAAREYLKDNGTLMFEVGYDGADEVADILGDAGYSGITITKDYSDIKRIVSATWTK